MFARALLIAVVTLGVLGGCEKTDHENIDKWTRTEKGPGKLKKALRGRGARPRPVGARGGEHDQDGQGPGGRGPRSTRCRPPRRIAGDRQARAAAVGPRARSSARTRCPAAPQIVAKDALISLRKYADEPQRQQIDGYLIDWYAVMSYEGRAKVGATLGATVMRMVGPPAGKKLISVVNGVIAAPGQEKTKIRIGDELLLGMAASANPEAVKYILDIARMDRGDPTLADARDARAATPRTSIPRGLFDLADPGRRSARTSTRSRRDRQGRADAGAGRATTRSR